MTAGAPAGRKPLKSRKARNMLSHCIAAMAAEVNEGGGGHGMATTVAVAMRMGAVGMTAAARVAMGTAAVMEVVKGLPRVVAAKTTAGRKA